MKILMRIWLGDAIYDTHYVLYLGNLRCLGLGI